MATNPQYGAVAVASPSDKDHRRKLAEAINRVNQGHMDIATRITLRASNTTTVLTVNRITPTRLFVLNPTTAHAATAFVAGIWFRSQTNGSVTFNHASSANVDQRFNVGIVG